MEAIILVNQIISDIQLMKPELEECSEMVLDKLAELQCILCPEQYPAKRPIIDAFFE